MKFPVALLSRSKQVSSVREVTACFNGQSFFRQNYFSLKLFVHVKSIVTLSLTSFSFKMDVFPKTPQLAFLEGKKA